MAQVIEVRNKKNTKKSEIYNTDKADVKVKTKFQEEWEKSIPAEKAFDDLLTYVRNL